ncbi:MAG: ribosome biogenesis GTP-binding protein YihA/YsxC [Chitinophagales bacterium]
MFIKSTNYIAGHTKLSQCPKDQRPEFAFLGRSNVGKSSLINMLCERNKLAKVSQTPGKTRLINYFLINENWYLIDLPGIGYAKVSKSQRADWEKMINSYLTQRKTLQVVFYLIDSRLKPQKNDLEFINWMGANHVPFVLVFTKADKPKPRELSQNIKTFKKTMLETWEDLPEIFITSANKKQGREEILNYIHSLLQEIVPEEN